MVPQCGIFLHSRRRDKIISNYNYSYTYLFTYVVFVYVVRNPEIHPILNRANFWIEQNILDRTQRTQHFVKMAV